MADIVLKDRNGNSIEYPGVNHIKVKTTDGATRDFVDSETVPEVVENYPVLPDFSNGDQILIAPDGYVVKSAIYKKPETLIPENIAEGVDVAGVIGTLAAGGGAKILYGTFTGNGGQVTIEHGMGEVPSIIIVRNISGTWPIASSQYYLEAVTGLSKNAQSILGITSFGGWYASRSRTASTSWARASGAQAGSMEVASKYPIANTTAATFTVGVNGNNDYLTVPDGTYVWIAIGGLT